MLRFATCTTLCLALCTALTAAEEPTPPEGYSMARPQVTITTNHGPIVAELFADQAPETVRIFIEIAEAKRETILAAEAGFYHFYDGLSFHRVIPNFLIQGGCPIGSGNGNPGFTFPDEINADSLGLDKEVALQGEQLHAQCAYMQDDFMQAMVIPKLRSMGLDGESTQEEYKAAFPKALKSLDGTTLKAFYEAIGYQYNAKLPPSSKPVRGSLAMANSGPSTNGSQFFINLVDTPHLTGKHTVFGQVIEGMEVVDKIAGVETDDRNYPKQPVVIQTIRLTKPATIEALFGEYPEADSE